MSETDLISRQAAIDALWNALYAYEDKTEKQFQESDELDVGDWIVHRIFVQNMSDIDRQTILALPSAQPERKAGRWIPCSERLPEIGQSVLLSVGGMYSAEGCLREDGDWAQFRWDAIQRKDMVGAWKPLPEPYKGERE